MRSFLLAWLWLLLPGSGALWALALPIAPVRVEGGSAARKAVEELRQGRWNVAMELARAAAEQDDADAFFLIGQMKETRELLRPSLVDSLDYHYRKADEQGHPEAKFRRWLVSDIAARRNRDEALANLTKAADEGNAAAARILGEAWLRGMVDGKSNAGLATELWEKAGAKGDGAAFHLLGELYGGTYGKNLVTVDPVVAAGHYRKALAAGFVDSYEPLCRILLSGEEPAGNVSEGMKVADEGIAKGVLVLHVVLGEHEERVTKDGKAARAHFLRGAEAGHFESMYRLANALLADGEREEGMRWLVKAADAGYPDAAGQLGEMLLPDDAAKAYAYLMVAGNEGIHRAQFLIGKMYLDGTLGAPDPKAAIPWFTEAMTSGDAEMQYQLAQLNERGIGCQTNFANAAVLYNLACGKGNMKAAGRIAHLSYEGLGMRRNLPQAWAYASLAIGSGEESLRPLLTKMEGEMTTEEKEAGRNKLKEITGDKPKG